MGVNPAELGELLFRAAGDLPATIIHVAGIVSQRAGKHRVPEKLDETPNCEVNAWASGSRYGTFRVLLL
jgi:hypothetical protein